jgi:adenosylcobinamide kinase/adenosylcobinamide-phosphate guanylyltransferase
MSQSQRITLVLGPARSGKSEWAETLAARSGNSITYVATARANPNDPEWQDRIQLHCQRRPAHWQTVEVPIQLAEIVKSASPPTCLLIDSLGTWLANLLEQDQASWEKTMTEFLTSLTETTASVILVAEEVGWGVVPAYPLGRSFRDRLGTLTRQIGSIANPVYLVTGGHVLNLSTLGTSLSP